MPLRDINELAGQRNASALHYHFGGRPELVQAIIDRYRLSDDGARRHRGRARSRGPHDIREVVEGLVDRSCAWLATPDGRDYIRVVFQFVIRLPLRQHLLEGTDPPSLASVRAQAELIHEALPDLPEHLVRERAVRVVRPRAARRWPSGPASSTTRTAAACSPRTSGRPT